MKKYIPLLIAVLSLATVSVFAAANLTWTDNSNNETGFKIERALVTGTTVGTFTQIGVTAANVQEYRDSTTERGKTYAYRVKAYNASGDSGYATSPQNFFEAGTVGIPANFALTQVILSPVSANPQSWQASFSWTDTTTDEMGFRIEYRKQTDGADDWKQAILVPANITTAQVPVHTDMSTPHHFRVRAVRSDEAGEPSAVVIVPPGSTFRTNPPTQLKVERVK